MSKLPLSGQLRAIETTRNIIRRGDTLKQSERDLMDDRLAAVGRTLSFLQHHEAAFRAFMAEQAQDKGS